MIARDIPGQAFIRDVKAIFNQRIIDGARSFHDPHYKGRPLPLWTINFWERTNAILDAQEKWQAANRWLVDHIDNSARKTVIEKCRQNLSGVGWNIQIG